MAELFIELFSEEIPSRLQIDARNKIKQLVEEKFNKREIKFKSSQSFSTPKRLVFVIDGIPEKIEEKQKILKGPKVDSPQIALDGFIKSNNLSKTDIYKKKIDTGVFYFAKIKAKVISVSKELETIIPEVLKNYSWKKSMKWADYDLKWGRPLKSIVVIFNSKIVDFNFYHLQSNNIIFIDDISGDRLKKINNFSSYLKIIESQNIILDHKKRKDIILKKMNKICDNKKLIKALKSAPMPLVASVKIENTKPKLVLPSRDGVYIKNRFRQAVLGSTAAMHVT